MTKTMKTILGHHEASPRWIDIRPVQIVESAGQPDSAELWRNRRRLKLQNILVPVDFSEASLLTLRHAARLADRHGSSISLLHVVDPGSFMSGFRDVPLVKPEEQLLREAATALRRLIDSEMPAIKVAFLRVKSGRVGPEIIRTAREARSDLIVLTVDNRSAVERIRHFLFGSTAAWVKSHAPCPVLTLSVPKAAPTLLSDELGRENKNGSCRQLAPGT